MYVTQGRWARAARTRAGSRHRAHRARREASENLSKFPEESRAVEKTREHARRRARAEASRRPVRAPDGPRWPQTPPEASEQCHERSGIFQIVFADLVRWFRACKLVVYLYKYPKGVHLYRKQKILGNSFHQTPCLQLFASSLPTNFLLL